MTLTDRTPVELAIAEAYRAGAEAMRERAAVAVNALRIERPMHLDIWDAGFNHACEACRSRHPRPAGGRRMRSITLDEARGVAGTMDQWATVISVPSGTLVNEHMKLAARIIRDLTAMVEARDAALTQLCDWFDRTEADDGDDYLNGDGREDGCDGWDDGAKIVASARAIRALPVE